ncbi:MAG: ATP-binding protein [Bdellovibrio sp.]
MRSKRLSRQLKKFMGVNDVTLESLGFENNPKPVLNDEHLNLLQQLPTFLDQVDSYYEQADKMVELSSRSLEISTKELSVANDSLMRLNATVNAMINSLNEGFIVFDKDGICTSVSSKRAIEFLGLDPFGKTLWDAFKIPSEEQESFIDWFNYLFNPDFDFSEMAEIGPAKLHHDSLFISIKYKPMLKDDELAGVIVILSDVTAEIQSAKRAEKFMYKAEMVTKFYANQNMFMGVLDLFSKNIAEFKAIAFDLNLNQPSKPEILRALHTLKGCAGAMYMMELSHACDHHENTLKQFWTDSTDLAEAKKYIRDISESLEISLVDFYKSNKELLGTHRNSKATETKNIAVENIERFCAKLKKIGNASLIDYFVDEFFTAPFEQLLLPFESLGYSTAKKLEKDVAISIQCDPAIRVFPEAYKEFFNSFVHIVNNAIDHGLENSETRIYHKKDKTGSLVIEANSVILDTNAEKILLSVTDDGGGINPSHLRAKLTKLGIDCSQENDLQVINHIFDIGVSTKDEVSSISGRGVGLNAVREEIYRMGGKISVKSELNKGTSFLIELPLIKPNSRQVDDLIILNPSRRATGTDGANC